MFNIPVNFIHLFNARARRIIPPPDPDGFGATTNDTNSLESELASQPVSQSATQRATAGAPVNNRTRQRASPKWRRAMTVAGQRQPHQQPTMNRVKRPSSRGAAVRSYCSTFTSTSIGYFTGECAEVRIVVSPFSRFWPGSLQ